ncbi:MAG: hypothetical protein LC739_00360 [Actinobacteria bacterium]|nr:hypothetical protein [Actinomycetota bacterium]
MPTVLETVEPVLETEETVIETEEAAEVADVDFADAIESGVADKNIEVEKDEE